MVRYFLEIAYKGTNFNGWQIQPNGMSVQEKIDEALSTILRDDIKCLGCGRTDAGVHASQFFLHFDTDALFPEAFINRMNSFLPEAIAIKKCISVHEKAHARFDAKMRTYEYYFTNKKDPFKREFCVFWPYSTFDFDIMQQACFILKKYNDFPSFCKSKQGSKTTIVNIKEVYWKIDENNNWTFYISADRFLRGMVRLIVGAMIQLGKHKMTLEQFDEGIKNGQRFKYAFSAPAHGLFLVKVQYNFIDINSNYIAIENKI